MLDLEDRLQEVRSRIRVPEQVLGSCIVQPFTGSNSGNRKLMWAIHDQHKIFMNKSEAPILSTANENEKLKYSSSYVVCDCKKLIIGRIDKFRDLKDLHYWLIALNLDGPEAGKLDVIERVDYVYNTESYGFKLATDHLDSLRLGSVLRPGDKIKCPANVDEFGNVMDGVNFLTAYMSNLDTQEDGYQVCDLAAEMLGSSLFHNKEIQLNDNDIMLNLYGNDDTYKVMPDIGEKIKDGILLAIRRQNNQNSLFDQTWNRLQTIITTTDKRITMNGTLIDIDILTNNPDQFETGPNAQYYGQIRGYMNNKFRYCGEILSYVEEYKHYHPEAQMTFALQDLYKHCKDTISGYDHIKNGKKYSGTIIKLLVRENLPANQGDKITNRYGGKGVISKIVPWQLMPRTEDGRIIMVIMNKSTVGGRLNYGQVDEMEINWRSRKVLQHILAMPITVEEKFMAIAEYMRFFSKQLGDDLMKTVYRLDEDERKMFLDCYENDGIIRLAIKPLSDNVTFDTLVAIDKRYPWIHEEYLQVPVINSNGHLRLIKKSLRPIVAGEEYFLRLKQYAKEKFSVTSISTVNLRNENSKSRAGKLYETPYADTPIRFGAMEQGDLRHMDTYKTGMTEISLMLYSSSSEARQNFWKMYYGDPVNINIELDEKSSSRSAEIFAAYFKQLGDEFVFEKRLKEEVKPPFSYKVKIDPPFEYKVKEVKVPFTYKFEGEEVTQEITIKKKIKVKKKK